MAGIPGQPAPKPGQIEKPIPNQDALDQALAALDSAPKKPLAGSSEASSGDALDQALQGQEGGTQEAQSNEPGAVMQGLDYAARGLDYLGGLTRTGVASSASVIQNALQGKVGDAVTPEDVKQALKGKAPSWSEYLKRMGLSEGGSFDVPGLGKVTLRGVEGFALDMLTDPLTYVAKAIKDAPYLKNLLNGPGQASEALGEAVYKSAFPKKAKDAAEVLIEQGAPTGGTAAMAQKVQDASNVMGKLRQGLYDKATELGVAVDTGFPLKRAESVIEHMNRDPALRPAAEELTQLLDTYKGMGKVPLDVLSEWKTNLYDALPKSAWTGQGGLRGYAKKFKGALAGDFRQAIVEAGNAAEKGLGDSIEALNSKWGALLSATQPLQKAAETGGGGKLGHMIDGAVLAMGGLKGAAVSKGYDLATSPYAKTVVGKALMKAGQSGLATGVANRTFINAAKAKTEGENDIPQQ